MYPRTPIERFDLGWRSLGAISEPDSPDHQTVQAGEYEIRPLLANGDEAFSRADGEQGFTPCARKG